MSRYVNYFGEELATFTMSNQLFSVGYYRRPVKPCSEILSDQRSRGCVVSAGSGMYVHEQLDAVVLGDALHQYFCTCVFAHESTIDL
jgi:hypothetical protein